jgi:DNA-binding MarR family transcriptional regulator
MSESVVTTSDVPLNTNPSFLLSQLGSHVSGAFAALLGPLGLLPREFGLLYYLARSDGQTQQGLADMLGIHRNSMVTLVDELESRGLVQRRRHPTDRRAHALQLTEKARELLELAMRAAEASDRALVDVLDETERATLISLLQRLVGHAGLTPGVHPDQSGATGRQATCQKRVETAP